MSRLRGDTPGAPRAVSPEWRAGRILRRLDELFEIGRAAGTNRPGLGAGEQRAHELVAGWMREGGLEVTRDAGGNLVGRLEGSEPQLPQVWSGSHLDTPPDGGRFDGALGVLSALDAVEAIAAGTAPRRGLTVIAFRLEEGPRFGRGVFGSRAICGMLDDDEGDLLDADGVSLAEAFRALGLGELPHAGWLDPPPSCFVELHIEQGPTLAAAGVPLGIVTSIAGMAGLELVFSGRRGHAGTVQMPLRSDALGAAARFVVDAHDVARALPGAVATIGRLTVAPGATNTIPERCELFADLRAPDDARVEALVDGAKSAARAAAKGGRLRGFDCAALALSGRRHERGAPGRAAAGRRVARPRAGRAPLGGRPRRRNPGARGRPERDAVRAQRRGRRQPRAGGVERCRRRHPGPAGTRGRTTRIGRRVIDWDALARPSLRGLVRYDPGPSRDDLKAEHGLAELEPLNWNEDRFEPPRRVLEAAAAEVFNAALYPERLFADFRVGLAGWLGVPAECLTPAHGAQALIASVAQVFIGPGTPVVVPQLTYGLYASVVGRGRRDRHARPARRARDRSRARSPRRPARPARASSGSATRTTPRARSSSGRRGRTSSTVCRADCIVVADEPYMDFADPAVRVDRPRDVVDGRAVIVIRSFSKIFGLAGLRLGYAISAPEVARLLDLVQEPFNVNRAALAAGIAGVAEPGFVEQRRAQVAAARDLLTAELEAGGLRVHPSHSNFVLVELGADDQAVTAALMRRGILVRGGSEFGLPGFARVTVAPEAVMRRTAAELVSAVRDA